MKFTKMHGCGNDYVYVNCFEEKVEDPSETAIKVSDRHFGIGSDGLILIKPSKTADFEMEMYNADGSEGSMCGNGIRCVAKYVYDFGLTDQKNIRVATKSGIKDLELTVEGEKVSQVRVNMGEPVFEAEKIPVLSETNQVIGEPVTVEGREYYMTCISMGNPHAVVPLKELENLKIEETGPKFEKMESFPDRVNTEFVKVLDRHTIQMRVWERGSGETYACGTGACAAAVAAITNHWVEDSPVKVKLLGGDLEIFWDHAENTVYMTGPATIVYSGEINL
ncbi:diaminopimelate epimerase [Blautia liquoris]|uniref:Diaminopimelate epimerase n=1 Tax=Blautia liquoris TaxID=2779518 RepID=A0A7M2RGR8_9FIRM|nr:diaminopimelate epimerase [Blautia liquoris]QOV19523.1 diaminopimelate epimerase [Blautia liquoris]